MDHLQGESRDAGVEGRDPARVGVCTLQTLPICLDTRGIISVMGYWVPGLSDPRREVLESEPDASGLAFTGPPLLLELVQDDSEVASVKLGSGAVLVLSLDL